MPKWVPVLKVILLVSLAIDGIAVIINLIIGPPAAAVPLLLAMLGGIFAYWFISTAKWGGVKCPNCGTAQPTWRKPASFRQAMWGGYTCANCGTEIDRRGEALSGPKSAS